MTVAVALPTIAETDELAALRKRVRGFVKDELAAGTFSPKVDAWLTEWDEAFSRKLADHGWLGMTIPVEYGGRGRTFLERFVVTEELLAHGAPVGAHWVADRQAAPTLLRFGTEEQKEFFLPRISRGEYFFAIGMSEPDSGSDLASVRTKATRVEGGWRLYGTKVWTSGAHRAHALFALARTSPVDPAQRHAGLSQFIVDLRSPGIEVRPILSLDGGHHFNEVHFEDVFVADEFVLGDIGRGWLQVTSELAYERSGPERFLSTVSLLFDGIEQVKRGHLQATSEFGMYLARLSALHEMSWSVSNVLEDGGDADLPAAMVKVIGTQMEGDLVEHLDHLLGDADGEELESLEEIARRGLLQRPGFTLRGGTTEILRGVIARGLGLR